MHQYNPAKDPKPKEWLAIDESARLDLIYEFHEEHGEFGESMETHATIHAVVETQLAMDVPNARDALVRLRKSGLTRHDAIHAIGSVLAEHLHELVHNRDVQSDEANSRYYERLRSFTKEDWFSES